ncbi:MAG: GLUG motif-containing protein, partial [Clostridia bacterium]|nr:GLUG motif-containing protein [Clostridia bacterium]
MNKKVLSIFLSICLIFSSLPFVLANEAVDDYVNNNETQAQVSEDTTEVTELSGSGTEQDPYRIGTKAELEFFRNFIKQQGEDYANKKKVDYKYNAENVWVALINDIDLAGSTWTYGIGSTSWSFDGRFDGKGYTIKNFTIETEPDELGWQCAGLFGYAYGDITIRNLKIENPTIKCKEGNNSKNPDMNAAVLLGYYMEPSKLIPPGGEGRANIENIHITGDIEINAETTGAVGGIVGYVYTSCKIKNCSVKGNDNSYIKSRSQVGGIVGYNQYGVGEITNCTVENIDITSKDKMGGIAGVAQGKNVISGCAVKDVNMYITEEVNFENVGAIVGVIDTQTGMSGVEVESCSQTNTNKILKSEDTEKSPVTAPTVGGIYGQTIPVPIRVDNQYFSSLNVAATVFEADQTVTFLSDTSLKSNITVDKNITFDLNGKKITGEGKINTSNAVLTICDNSDDEILGQIDSVVSVDEGSTLKINSGKVKFEKAENTTPYITVEKNIQGGSVAVEISGSDKTKAEVTTTVNSGYTFGKLSVTTGEGEEVEVEDNTFTMPSEDVTISATFEKKP